MGIKFGIMQGRLSNEKLNILQKYPANWSREFDYIKDTKLDYIEFFTEQRINIKNPIWSHNGIKKIKEKIKNLKYNKIILCDNFSNVNSFVSLKTFKYFKSLIHQLSFFSGSKLIIPILSKNLENTSIFDNHINTIKDLLDYSKKKKVKLSFEIDNSFYFCQKLCNEFMNNKNFGITFDTGNSFNYDMNFFKNIKILRNYINHIHLKDRDLKGKNVVLGNGKVQFDTFFKYLNHPKPYSGTMTFETHRGKNAVDTAKKNFKIIKNFLKK